MPLTWHGSVWRTSGPSCERWRAFLGSAGGKGEGGAGVGVGGSGGATGEATRDGGTGLGKDTCCGPRLVFAKKNRPPAMASGNMKGSHDRPLAVDDDDGEDDGGISGSPC